jgi:LysM repeat protein
MRKWIMSVCAVLIWCLLSLTAVAGARGPEHPAQASNGTAASSTASNSTASSTRAVLASESVTASEEKEPATAGKSEVAVVSAEVTVARAAADPARTWTVRPGDTLSGIAAALGVPGGWPALYAANRQAVGPDPGLIRPGTVLAVPGANGPVRYTVAPGDTLSAIAAVLDVPGGWPALYAANRQAVGPDPDVIRPGTVLTAPRAALPGGQAASRPTGPGRPQSPHQAPAHQGPSYQGPSRQAPSHRASARRAPSRAPAATRPPRGQQAPPASGGGPSSGRTVPGRQSTPGQVTTSGGGMPRWLEDLLIAAGVLAATAFAAEPAAAIARRRKTARPAGRRTPAGPVTPPGPGARDRQAADKARIVLADHERLIVTYCAKDHAVYVLTPPGEDPRTVLRAARLVVPEDTYEELAGRLGVPAAWPLE